MMPFWTSISSVVTPHFLEAARIIKSFAIAPAARYCMKELAMDSELPVA